MNKYFFCILKAHLIFSFLFLFYYFLASMSTLYESVNGFVKYFAEFVVTLFGYLIIVGFAFWKRKKIVKIWEDLYRQVKKSNSTRLRRLERRFKYCVYGMVLYHSFLTILAIKTEGQYQELGDKGNISLWGSAKRFCLQCNISLIPVWGRNALFTMESTFLTPSLFTLCMWTSTIYVIFAVLLTELIGDLKNKIENMAARKFSSDSIKVVQGRLKTLYDLTNSTNDVFQNLILLWLACTLFSLCITAVSCFDAYDLYLNSWVSLLLVFLCSVQNILALTVVVFVSSRVHDQARRCFTLILSLAKDAIRHSRDTELELLYLHFRVRKLSLKAGGCFQIDKELYLSFLGVCVTYAVVYLQMSPRSLERIQNNT